MNGTALIEADDVSIRLRPGVEPPAEAQVLAFLVQAAVS